MKPVRWTDDQEHPTPWRHGRSVYRTIYDADEVLIGMMDTADLAEHVIEVVNDVATPDMRYRLTLGQADFMLDNIETRTRQAIEALERDPHLLLLKSDLRQALRFLKEILQNIELALPNNATEA